ncbi:hypothetical protein IPA_06100 [Ignicoccus pacificus DSM 13166]|uniref:Uncharacterized protein n=1 Tax=Ignicoccus pacificus DSM 13166 TaxID=940294 RepID=A0A977PLP3_9CREN|nr:hypothetical protein IPA_06100 [Ignicoccus pacificus DSM 13166]
MFEKLPGASEAEGYWLGLPKLTPRDVVLIAIVRGAKEVNDILKLHDELASRGMVTIPSEEEIIRTLRELDAFGIIRLKGGKIELVDSEFSEEFKESLNFKVRLVNVVGKEEIQISTTN